jgi:two-component system, NarL family, response regulator
MRILCVDDHLVVLAGLSAIIQAESDMEVVACAVDGKEAIELFQRHKPDVTLMDLRMPGMSGIETMQAIRSCDKHARIVVLTMYSGDQDIYRALEAGAAAYLLKDTLADNLVRVLRDVNSGKMSPAMSTALHMHRLRNTAGLTSREVEVLEGLATGLRNKEIAAKLNISEETVQAHMKRIFAKLEVHDRTAALAAGVRRGIIHLDE